MNNECIDFVVLWVDCNDPAWQSKRAEFRPDKQATDVSAARYRDWDLLRYWFRGVHRFAPWVRKIHFVTDGQIPEWLNVEHPKLNCVSHSDYMPGNMRLLSVLPRLEYVPNDLGMHRCHPL